MTNEQTVIVMASNKKEAKERAQLNYGSKVQYEKPYHYASKGNNFYQFKIYNDGKQ